MFKKMLIVTAMAVMGITIASQADAAVNFKLKVNSGGTTEQNLNTSCGAGCLEGTGVTINGNPGNQFTINTVQASYVTTGHGISLALTALTLTHTSNSAGNMKILMTYKGLTGNQVVALENGSVTLSGNTSGAKVTAHVYISDTNGFYDETTEVASATQNGTGTKALTGNATSNAALYSVTVELDVHFNEGTNNKRVTIAFDADVVPEPATLALLGMGLLLAGLAFGKRRDRNDPAQHSDLAA